MKKFLKERTSGLFLLIFAFFIISAVSLGQGAQSNDYAELSVKNQIADNYEVAEDDLAESDEAVLGVSGSEVIKESSGEKEKFSDEKAPVAEATKLRAETLAKAEAEKYAELKDDLKKYCDKKYDSKKCKKYLSEAKTLSKSDKEYKKLYEKYLEKKEDREADSDDSKSTEISPDEKALTLDFVVKSPNGDKKFEIQFMEGETVYEVMKRAKEREKINYEKNTDETYGVYINTINGLKEGSEADWTQNKYWILYVNGKSSSLGCSAHKLEKTDRSIEWRYEKYAF